MEWPPGVRPLGLSDFETQARRLRYQALGTACRAQNINSLLVAHHADDQAETVLMRLTTGQKGLSLRGMHQFTNIPECWGIHGVDKSGFYERPMPALRRKWILGHRPTFPVFEHAGVVILRPLLNFVKQDLIDTCNAHDVAWVEDETNKDTWRTPRNAVRNLLGNLRLPTALRKRSLLKLSMHMKVKETAHLKIASRLLGQCRIEAFDVRSGRIFVRLPKLEGTEAIFHDDRGRVISRTLAVALLVRQLAIPISPQDDVSLHSLQLAATTIFPELEDSAETDHYIKTLSTKFTVAGVQFERIPSQMLDVPNDARSSAHPRKQQRHSLRLDPHFSWSLSRQPFMSAPAGSEALRSETALPYSILISPPTHSRLSQWSPWYLWDGRYWIRVMRGPGQTLRLRPFRETDLRIIRSTLPKSKLTPLEGVLALAAPGKVRWTLPVIMGASADITGRPEPLALPTLGEVGNLEMGHGRGEKYEYIKCEVRYKQVDLQLGNVDGWKVQAKSVRSWDGWHDGLAHWE